jgi:hypothetical protein
MRTHGLAPSALTRRNGSRLSPTIFFRRVSRTESLSALAEAKSTSAKRSWRSWRNPSFPPLPSVRSQHRLAAPTFEGRRKGRPWGHALKPLLIARRNYTTWFSPLKSLRSCLRRKQIATLEEFETSPGNYLHHDRVSQTEEPGLAHQLFPPRQVLHLGGDPSVRQPMVSWQCELLHARRA